MSVAEKMLEDSTCQAAIAERGTLGECRMWSQQP